MRHNIRLLPLALIVCGLGFSTGCSTLTAQAGSLKQSAKRNQKSTTVIVTTTSLPVGKANSPYPVTTLSASGGSLPYAWKISAGQLPAGLSLSSAGVLSGTPTTGGSSTFTVQVLDASVPPQKTSASLTISITALSAPALLISTTSLPGGTANTPYSSTLSATGGTSPYAWSIAAGQLPAGLSLSSSGSISGTPTTAGQFSFTVQAVDSAATAQKASMALSLSIAAALPPAPSLSINTSSLPGGTVNTGYSGTIGATGGTLPYTWSVASGQLPTGLTLSPAGSISGVPAASGQYSFTARVSDASATQQSASQTYTVSIVSSSNSIGSSSTNGLLTGSTPSSYSVPTGWTLFAKENFESGACATGSWCGGNFVTTQFHNDGDSTHTHALSCTYGTPTGNCGGLNWNKFLPVGTREVYVSFYEWLDTSFRMNDEMFLMRFHWDTGNGQPMFREAILDYFQDSAMQYNSTDATLLWNIQGQPYYQNKLPGNSRGDQTNWTIATGRWVQHEMYAKFSTISGTIPISGSVAVNAAAKTYTRSSGSWIADGVSVGSSPHFTGFANAYNNGDGASGGGATSYFVTAVTDTVMTVDDGNGLLANEGPVSGLNYQIDHADGAYSYYKDGVRVAYQTNMINPGKVDFSTSNTTLSLMESYSKLIWRAPVNGSCETKAPFTGTCSTGIGNGACGYEYLPYGWNTSGYTKSSATSGFDTPIDCSTTAGGPMPNPPVFNRYLDDVIVLTKSDAVSASTPAPLAISSNSLANGTVNTSYSASLSASGGSSPYTWSITSGQLPAGIILSPSGTISGTPTASGQFSVTVQVADSSPLQQKASSTLSVSIGAATSPASSLVISTTSLPSGTVNSSYSAVLSAKGGVSPYKWSLAAGQMPPGITLSSTGQLAGTPLSSSSYSIDAMATDQIGQSTTQPLMLDVAPAPPNNGIQPMSLSTSSDSYAHYWNFDFPGYAGFRFGDGTGSLLCPNGNNACQGVMGFWDLKNDPSKQYNYGAFDTGMFEHQWNDILNANGTGRDGSTSNEYKEAGGSDQTFTVAEQNNVRVKIVQSGPIHPYGDHTYPADKNVTMTKTYVFYRHGTGSASGGAKVYTTTTLNYDGLDGLGPLNLQHNWGYSKVGWARISGEPAFHNDMGCGIVTTFTPTPWQVIYQAPGDYRYKDWMLLAPTAPNGGASEQITALSCATPNGPTPGHVYSCNSPSASGCGSTSDLGAVVKTNFLQVEREAQGSYMPLGTASTPIYFEGGLRFNWSLPTRTLAAGAPQTWQSVGFLGDNGIMSESAANTYSSEYKAPPSVTLSAGTGGTFDPVEGFWKMTSNNNVLGFSANGTLNSPALQISSWTGSAPSTIRVGGSTLILDVDYVAVVSNNTLLLQILKTIPSGTMVQIP